MEEPKEAIKRATGNIALLEKDSKRHISKTNHDMFSNACMLLALVCLGIAGVLLFNQLNTVDTHIQQPVTKEINSQGKTLEFVDNSNTDKEVITNDVASKETIQTDNSQTNTSSDPVERTEQVQAITDKELFTENSETGNTTELDNKVAEVEAQVEETKIEETKIQETPVAPVQTPTLIEKNSATLNKQEISNDLRLHCAGVGQKLGAVSVEDCLKYDFVHSGFRSTEGKALTYVDSIPDQVNDETRKVLLFGGIHGDEFSAVSVVFKWLENLHENRDDPDSDFSNIHWRVIPVLNPDGLLKPHGKSQRMNAHDVDLNRNFPTPDWEEKALTAWKERTGSNKRRYPGASAASEIETQWVLHLLERFEPDAVISVHAPFGIVDADGPAEPPQKLGPLELKLLGTYPGSMGRYIGVHKNLPMLTVELERAGSMPKKKDIQQIWFDIQDWIDAKVVSAKANNTDGSVAPLQSIRREGSNGDSKTVINEKAGD